MKGHYNPNLVWFNKIQIRFLPCVECCCCWLPNWAGLAAPPRCCPLDVLTSSEKEGSTGRERGAQMGGWQRLAPASYSSRQAEIHSQSSDARGGTTTNRRCPLGSILYGRKVEIDNLSKTKAYEIYRKILEELLNLLKLTNFIKAVF